MSAYLPLPYLPSAAFSFVDRQVLLTTLFDIEKMLTQVYVSEFSLSERRRRRLHHRRFPGPYYNFIWSEIADIAQFPSALGTSIGDAAKALGIGNTGGGKFIGTYDFGPDIGTYDFGGNTWVGPSK